MTLLQSADQAAVEIRNRIMREDIANEGYAGGSRGGGGAGRRWLIRGGNGATSTYYRFIAKLAAVAAAGGSGGSGGGGNGGGGNQTVHSNNPANTGSNGLGAGGLVPGPDRATRRTQVDQESYYKNAYKSFSCSSSGSVTTSNRR